MQKLYYGRQWPTFLTTEEIQILDNFVLQDDLSNTKLYYKNRDWDPV